MNIFGESSQYGRNMWVWNRPTKPQFQRSFQKNWFWWSADCYIFPKWSTPDKRYTRWCLKLSVLHEGRHFCLIKVSLSPACFFQLSFVVLISDFPPQSYHLPNHLEYLHNPPDPVLVLGRLIVKKLAWEHLDQCKGHLSKTMGEGSIAWGKEAVHEEGAFLGERSPEAWLKLALHGHHLLSNQLHTLCLHIN